MTNVREIVAKMRSQVDLSDLKAYAQWYQRLQRDAVDFAKLARQSIEQSRALNALERGAKNAHLAVGNVVRGFRGPGVGARSLDPLQAGKPTGPGVAGGTVSGSWAGVIKQTIVKNVGLDTVKDVLLAGDQFNQVQAQLAMSSQGEQEHLFIDQRLVADSVQARQPFAQSADLFLRIHPLMQSQGKGARDSLNMVAATGLSLTASGSDPQQTSAFMAQFVKDLAQGKLSGEGFQNMLANNRRMLTYLLEGLNKTNPALGVTRQNLFELAEQGLITSDMMVSALGSQLNTMRGDVEKLPASLANSLTEFSDKLARVSGVLQQQTGVIELLSFTLKVLGDHLEQIAHLLLLVGAAQGLRKLEAGMGALLGKGQSVTQMLRGLVGVAGVLAKELWVAVRPFLRWMIIVEAISLVIQDVISWFQGGDSVLGSIIGRSEQWQGEIEAVRGALVWVKDLLGGGAETVDSWIEKWGAVLTVVTGLVLLIGGIPALIVTLVVLILSYRDEIVSFAKDFWDTFVLAAEQTWVEIKATFTRMFNWFEEQFANVGAFFSSMVPELPSWATLDGVKSALGFETATPVSSTGAAGQYTDNRTMTVTVQTKDQADKIVDTVGQAVQQYGFANSSQGLSARAPYTEAPP
ncbi:tape measure protein [Alcaligenes nematophilus]|uniref:tape measure protein n=1 Tax=Alcaligenes nematophilus TaxID=2994643 RepID=UPI00246197F4|nr:tape measure protein [Alcaligenes nematophilus]MDH4866623.1 tape measure protein [Bacillus cereus]MDY7127923.1 tape measure protein [Alcaligenes nematophilus]